MQIKRPHQILILIIFITAIKMPSVWATQILPDYCQSEKLCQNKCPAKAQGTASLNLWKACTTVDTWTNWVSHVEFRPTHSPIVLMKLGIAFVGDAMGKAGMGCCQSHGQAAAGKGNLWDKAGSNPSSKHPSQAWRMYIGPVGPAPAANPLHLQSTCSCTQTDPTPGIQLGRLPKPLEYRLIK